MNVGPGFDGTFRGTCVVCLVPTDTGLALRGEAEWVAAGLSVLGVPIQEAIEIMKTFPGPLEGDLTVPIQVCEPCASRSRIPFKTGLTVTGLPLYRRAQ